MVEALKPGVEMTRAKILKRKKDLSDLQIFLFYFKRVDPLPRFAKGAGVWGLRRPCHPAIEHGVRHPGSEANRDRPA